MYPDPRPPPDGGSGSVASGAPPTIAGEIKPSFDSKPKQPAWLLDEGLPNRSSLLKGIYEAKLNDAAINVLTTNAIMQRCKSPACTRDIIRRVGRLIVFPPTIEMSRS